MSDFILGAIITIIFFIIATVFFLIPNYLPNNLNAPIFVTAIYGIAVVMFIIPIIFILKGLT